MKDVNCPYCGADLEINHVDGYGYEENERHSQECSECGKTFVYETSIMISHEVFPAPCLNNQSDHEWKKTITFPPEFSKMECKICGERRAITEEDL